MQQEIIKRFNSVYWHDSKIRSFQITRRTEGTKIFDDISFEFDLYINQTPGQGKWKNTTLTFKDCFLFKSFLYLIDKRHCNDDIENAVCMNESELKDLALNEIGRQANEYLYFKIDFVAPGGEIEILAKNFEIV